MLQERGAPPFFFVHVQALEKGPLKNKKNPESAFFFSKNPSSQSFPLWFRAMCSTELNSCVIGNSVNVFVWAIPEFLNLTMSGIDKALMGRSVVCVVSSVDETKQAFHQNLLTIDDAVRGAGVAAESRVAETSSDKKNLLPF